MHINVYLCLTTRCQLECQHCYGNCNVQGKDLDIEKAKKFLKRLSQDLAKFNLTGNLIFHGGEPLLVGVNTLKEFCFDEVIKTFTLSLQTNLIYEISAELKEFVLKYTCGAIGTSYDPEIRKLNGSFLKFKEIWESNVCDLLKSKIYVSVNVTATKIFIKEWKKHFDYLLKLGIREIHIERFVPSGRGRIYKNQLYVNDDEFFIFMIELLEFYEKNFLNIDLKGEDFFYLNPLDVMIASALNWEGASCWSHRCLIDTITLFPTNQIYTCPELAFRNILSLGTLDNTPEDILSHPAKLEFLNKTKRNLKCECYFLCHAGCPVNPHKCSINGNCKKFFKKLLKVAEKHGTLLQQKLVK